jgi:hypothetical protein
MKLALMSFIKQLALDGQDTSSLGQFFRIQGPPAPVVVTPKANVDWNAAMVAVFQAQAQRAQPPQLPQLPQPPQVPQPPMTSQSPRQPLQQSQLASPKGALSRHEHFRALGPELYTAAPQADHFSHMKIDPRPSPHEAQCKRDGRRPGVVQAYAIRHSKDASYHSQS